MPTWTGAIVAIGVVGRLSQRRSIDWIHNATLQATRFATTLNGMINRSALTAFRNLLPGPIG
jgi:hypothetical protein